jgi:hypothetical protein
MNVTGNALDLIVNTGQLWDVRVAMKTGIFQTFLFKSISKEEQPMRHE